MASFIIIIVSAGEAAFNGVNFADKTIAHQFCAMMKVCYRTLPASCLPDQTIFFQGINHGPTFNQGVGKGFLAIDMYTGICAGNGRNGMPVVRQGNHHGVNIAAGHNFFEITVGFTILIVVIPIHKIPARFKVFLINITNGNNLNIIQMNKMIGIVIALPAKADDAHGDAFICCDPARNSAAGTAGDDIGQCCCATQSCHTFHKGSAGDPGCR